MSVLLDPVRLGNPKAQATYEYRLVAVRRVVDGDTFDVTLDVGFEALLTPRIRLAVVNAPERKDDPVGAGRAALFLMDWIREKQAWLAAVGSSLRVSSYKRDSFGRWVADLFDPATGESVSSAMLAAGVADYYRP